MKTLPAGTELEIEQGLITRIWAPNKHLWVEAQGDAGKLVEAHFRLPNGGRATLRTGHGNDEILGPVDAFFVPDQEEPLALVGSIDWANPAHIPAVDKPAKLPSGLGAAVLNYLSLHALLNETPSLRYRGPYATGKLFDSLFRSFHLADQDPIASWQLFNEGVEHSALKSEVVSPAVDFFPAPFEWLVHTPEVCAEVRSSLERLMIEGRTYAVDEQGSRQLLKSETGYQAAVCLGGQPWAIRLDVDAQGMPLGELKPIPDLDSPMMGRELDPRLLKVLANALVQRAPDMLQQALTLVLSKVPVSWGHAGDEACVFDGSSFILHAGMSAGLANQPPETVLTALVYALEPAVSRVAGSVLQTHQDRVTDSTK